MQNIDTLTLGLYFALLVIGILTVFAVSYDKDTSKFFDFNQPHGKQLIWMFISIIAGFSLLTFDSNFFTKFSIPLFIAMLAILAVTRFASRDINGARSWLQVGAFQFQPAEFAKTATALMLAKFVSMTATQPRNFSNKLKALCIIGLPMVLIILEDDLGSALVYAAFIIVLYREGFKVNEVVVVLLFGLCFILSLIMSHLVIIYVLTGCILIYVILSSLRLIRKQRQTGILFIVFFAFSLIVLLISFQSENIKYIGGGLSLILFIVSFMIVRRQKNHDVRVPVLIYLLLALFVAYGTDFIMHDVLEAHQSERVLTLVGKSDDPDANYNVEQSKITIGSGGVTGKGYLNGTLTQLKHVPEQDTDFIFCTIGEEFGFIGTTVFLLIYLVFILRIIYIAERQRSVFSRVYIYSVAAIFFLQIMINIGMAIGLLPVIGIPLPFISYGGSSVLAFSIMIFIMLRLDADRLLILR